MSDYGIIVCDASPLITLAKAGELDVLLRQSIPVVIPDAVYSEATSAAHRDATTIFEWVRDNRPLVTVEQTEAGLVRQAAIEAGLRARHMGETAAIEVADRFLGENPDGRAVLLYEDAGLRKREVDPRADLVTTGAFLKGLEQAGRIQSADRILDLAETGGRDVSRQRGDAPVNDPPRRLVDQFRGGSATGLLNTEPERSTKPQASVAPTSERSQTASTPLKGHSR